MAAPSLPDDLIEEVLLRVRANDPASLVRAALACKRWCRLVADPAFRHRRLERHGATPPMLGFLCEREGNIWTHDKQKQPFTRFMPTSSCCPPRADHHCLRSFEARHGRVLLQDRLGRHVLIVWDPVTDQRVVLPRPPQPPWTALVTGSSTKATVLCAATTTGACDHLDCHRGHFIVVLVGTDDVVLEHDGDGDEFQDDDFHYYDSGGNDLVQAGQMFTCTYSSESGAWSDLTYPDCTGGSMWYGRSALVGSTLFIRQGVYEILRYDLCTQEMTSMVIPRADMIPRELLIQWELTTLEDGRLGLVRREESNKLCLWSWDEEADNQVVVGSRWTLRRVIDLKKLFPLIHSGYFSEHHLVGVVEGICVAFMAVEKCGLFTIDIKTGLMNKVSEDFDTAYWAVPYIDFCTPALRAPLRDDEPVE